MQAGAPTSRRQLVTVNGASTGRGTVVVGRQ